MYQFKPNLYQKFLACFFGGSELVLFCLDEGSGVGSGGGGCYFSLALSTDFLWPRSLLLTCVYLLLYAASALAFFYSSSSLNFFFCSNVFIKSLILF